MRNTLIILLVLTFFQSHAQEIFREPFIEVSGTAEMEIDPNEITLWIRLKEFEESKNKIRLEKIDEQFLSALKAAGIDKKRLTLADVGSTLSKVTRRDKETFREKTYELVLTGSGELEKLLASVEPVEIDLLQIRRIDHTDMDKFKMDVKIGALKAAKQKAETLATSIGVTAGKPLMIREWDEGPVYPMMQANISFKDAREADMSAEDPTAFRKIKLTGRVTAQFAIQ